MRSSINSRSYSHGFTLVELVSVIVLLGIVATASSQFIRQAIEIYSDSIDYDRLQQQGRFSIERMTRELRNALPGSIRVSSDVGIQCLEFMPIKAASNYLQQVTGANVTTLPVVDIGYSFVSGDRLVIFPIENSSVYGAAATGIGDISGATAAVGNVQTISLSSENFLYDSPSNRFYIVNQPVSFCASDNSITRHQGYIATASAVAPPNSGSVLARNIRLQDGVDAVTVFVFSDGVLQRSGLVSLDLRFSETTSLGNDWARFRQQVLVRNAP
ncbi:MAG: MSHA biogenesis protein MshO [Oceanicoccus sp.]|jgi:MSHA biogenesis protein MshO